MRRSLKNRKTPRPILPNTDSDSLLSHVLIITRLVPEYDRNSLLVGLDAITHQGKSLKFEVGEGQRVNLISLSFHEAPIAILCDQVYYEGNMLRVPATALVAVAPIAAADITELLRSGNADKLQAALHSLL